MRTIFLKASQHLSLYESQLPANLIKRYGQLLIYLTALGIIAYLYVVANGLFLQYLAEFNPGSMPTIE
jgi:hypothetical protein